MTKEELSRAMEEQRARLNAGIENGEAYDVIYQESLKMDRLLEQYLVAENMFGQHVET